MNTVRSMRIFRNPVTVALAMWVSVFAVCFILFAGCGGCAAGKGQLNPATQTYSADLPASTLVVTVENVRETALGLFDIAMRTEAENREALAKVSPGFHAFAERIRRDGKGYLDTLTAGKVAFQKSRSEADATALKNALAAIQPLINDAIKYLGEAAKR